MMARPRETYEHEGPKCPCCERQFTADDPGYYYENSYTEETCDECGVTFDVSVNHSVTWTCTERLP